MNRTGNGGSGGSRELFTANRCEPEPERLFLNRKRHEPEPDLFFNPFLILDPDEKWRWPGPGSGWVQKMLRSGSNLLVSSLGVHF